MSKERKKMNVPKLRFPQFRDSKDWTEITLIDTIDKNIKWSFTGGPFGSNLKSSDYVYDGSGIRVIQLQNIGDAEFFNEYKIFTSEEKADELLSSNIYPGDIILSKMGDPVGRACLIPTFHFRYVMCSDGIRLVVDEKKFNKYFIYVLINSVQFRSLVEKAATGSTRKRIGLDDLKNIPLVVPSSINEQQKIADCLSSLNDLITAETQKLDTLKSHKKGLMQQLFPAEGETVPKLRFKEFRDSGEWELMPIGSKIDSISGYPFASEDMLQDPFGIPLMRGINITEGIIRHNYEIDRYFHGKIEGLEKYILRKDDLVIGMDGSKVGKNSALINDDDSGSLLVQRIARLRANRKDLIQFVFQKINSTAFHSYVDRINTSGGIPHISLKQIQDFQICFPPSAEEQQKIADFLFSLDELITAQTERTEILKLHKKGLMQQLFPNVNESNA